MVRKRVILLGITLGLILNQFMLWQCNRVISAPNYSYTTANSSYNYNYYNTNRQNPYYGGQYVQPQGYDIDLDRYKNLQQLDYYRKLAGGGTTDLAPTYADMQKNLFNQKMAQQAGVPYEEYICQGLTEARRIYPNCLQHFVHLAYSQLQ